MKKITERAVKAFINFEKFNQSNTNVIIEDWFSKMYLYNNLIATLDRHNLGISSADWQTNTTKERLNWILKEYNYYIKQKNFVWYLVNWKTKEWIEFKKDFWIVFNDWFRIIIF